MTNFGIKTPRPITSDVNNEWTVFADFGDGKLVKVDVTRLVLLNEKRKIATLYGESPMSTEAFRYTQTWRVGGGGAATIMWSRDPEGKLYVGGVLQNRAFIDKLNKVFNIARGFSRPGEDIRDAARRELDEEVGQIDLLVPQLLPGAPVNMDSAWFESEGEWSGTVEFFHLYVPWELLVPQDDGSYTFELETVTEEKKKEAIFGAKFVSGETIPLLADAPSIVGYARLLSYLANAS